jgi:hypothetical protein
VENMLTVTADNPIATAAGLATGIRRELLTCSTQRSNTNHCREGIRAALSDRQRRRGDGKCALS